MQQTTSQPKRSFAATLLVAVVVAAVCWLGTGHANVVTGAFAALPSVRRGPARLDGGLRSADVAMSSYFARRAAASKEREENMKKAAELRKAYLEKVAVEDAQLEAQAELFYGPSAQMRPRADPEGSYAQIGLGPFFNSKSYSFSPTVVGLTEQGALEKAEAVKLAAEL
jgi:hypothetical protein